MGWKIEDIVDEENVESRLFWMIFSSCVSLMVFHKYEGEIGIKRDHKMLDL